MQNKARAEGHMVWKICLPTYITASECFTNQQMKKITFLCMSNLIL